MSTTFKSFFQISKLTRNMYITFSLLVDLNCKCRLFITQENTVLWNVKLVISIHYNFSMPSFVRYTAVDCATDDIWKVWQREKCMYISTYLHYGDSNASWDTIGRNLFSMTKSWHFWMIQIHDLRTLEVMWRIANDLDFSNFDPMGVLVLRAQKSKMKYPKISLFRHIEDWQKLVDEMKKSLET